MSFPQHDQWTPGAVVANSRGFVHFYLASDIERLVPSVVVGSEAASVKFEPSDDGTIVPDERLVA